MALFVRWISVVVLLAALACGLESEKPPAPGPAVPTQVPGEEAPPEAAPVYDPAKDVAILTFAGERGTFVDANKAESISEEGKAMVRVTLQEGPVPPPGMVWVGDFRQADAEGRVPLTTVPRDEFEERALGQGLASPVALGDGVGAPSEVATSHGDIIVYKTAWCGVCRKLEAYLKKKGVPFQSKDIEKDGKAAAELRAKAARKGLRTQSVPIIDVRGELIVGFDRAKLERLL